MVAPRAGFSRRSTIRATLLLAPFVLLPWSAGSAGTSESGIRSTTLRLGADDTLPIDARRAQIHFRSATLRGSPSGVVAPAFGSAGDPTPAGASGGGAQLTIYRIGGTADDVVVIDLPAGRWMRAGGAGTPEYRYKDPRREDGPISKVHVHSGGLTIQGKGDGLYHLGGAPQGALALRLQLGTGETWCARAPARTPVSKFDTTARFEGARADAAACAAPPTAGPARNLPLLPEGRRVGTKSFSPVELVVLPAVEARIDEAVAAGMAIARVHLDWSELEPDLGTYALDVLQEDLSDAAARGLVPMLTLGFTDTSEYALPADLMDPEDPTQLAPGVHLDDPGEIARFEALLDLILPDLLSHGVWLVSLANEPNVLLADLTPARRAVEEPAMARFTRAIREHVHAAEPSLAVSITFAEGGFVSPPVELLRATDVVTFNFGCLVTSSFTLARVADVHLEVGRMLSAARGRPIVIQELSSGGGYEDRPSLLGASLAYQAEWFEAFYDELARRPRVRAAFVLDTVDWPEWLARLSSDFLRDEGLPTIADEYEEFLRTCGLLRFDDASTKPAWNAFLAELASEGAP